VSEYRTDVSEREEYMQASARLLKKDTHIVAHKHLLTEKHTIGTQEAWVVIEGSVTATIYDLDDSKLEDIVIDAGDMIVFYRGGHELTASEDTIFYEFKTGPYLGYEYDKTRI
jgi:mannose-6-phosphate isomerase-like protein (cupin superfamily)